MIQLTSTLDLNNPGECGTTRHLHTRSHRPIEARHPDVPNQWHQTEAAWHFLQRLDYLGFRCGVTISILEFFGD